MNHVHIILALSMLGNAALGWAYLGQRDKTTKASTDLTNMQQERFGSTSWVHVSTRVPDKRVNRVITITSAGAQLGVQEV